MSEIYFPSCNFTKMAPTAAKAIRSYLAEKMQVAGCCRVDKLAYEEGLTGLYFCQACRETLENRVPGKYQLKNLFEYLVDDKDFPWPDYSGLTATVQDCWRDRNHPEIHETVRTALAKMKVRVIEMEENREKAVYCGNIHFEPHKPENILLMEQYKDKPLVLAPEEVQKKLFEEQAEKYPCDNVITYCNRCTLCIRTVGVNGIHLMELAMGTYGA
ncbi:MAG: hypothetical protein IIY45_07200 [Firmicutes bacterium]|nr:hypothetical protein [Bacillota bacterium]